MKRVIWKYQLDYTYMQNVQMPRGAEILTAQLQAEQLYLWAIVDMEQVHQEARMFTILGTGELMPDRILRHIDTVQQGQFVWHVFEG